MQPRAAVCGLQRRARRLPGSAVRYEVSGQNVPVPRTGDLEADVTTLMAELAARLEGEIRKAPEQYFWFHRRWKTRPPAELSPSEAGMAEAVSAPADPEPDDA